MKGYPTRLNTREDYEYVREHFQPEQWKPDWQALLDSMKDWFAIATFTDESKGVTDETHKYTEETNEDTGETYYIQWELQVVPMSKLSRLGFSEDYVKQVLGE